jgi:hypothetical protein
VPVRDGDVVEAFMGSGRSRTWPRWSSAALGAGAPEVGLEWFTRSRTATGGVQGGAHACDLRWRGEAVVALGRGREGTDRKGSRGE